LDIPASCFEFVSDFVLRISDFAPRTSSVPNRLKMALQDRTTGNSSLRIRVAPEELTLTDWPLRQRPVASLVALAAAGGAAWLAGWLSGSPIAGGVVAAALAIALWRTWIPVRYELGGGGIVQSVFGWQRRIAWIAIQHYELHEDGVLLLPDAAAAPLSPLRGLYLRWGQRRDEVLAHLEYYLQSWHAARRAEFPG
jgi:hypothetical protein